MKPVTFQDMVVGFTDRILRGAGRAPYVGIGPTVWDIESVRDTRHWYVVFAVISAARKLRLYQLKFLDQSGRETVEQARSGVMVELVNRRPVVMVDFDDELAFAKWCETLVPGNRTRRIRAGIEQERAR